MSGSSAVTPWGVAERPNAAIMSVHYLVDIVDIVLIPAPAAARPRARTRSLRASVRGHCLCTGLATGTAVRFITARRALPVPVAAAYTLISSLHGLAASSAESWRVTPLSAKFHAMPVARLRHIASHLEAAPERVLRPYNSK